MVGSAIGDTDLSRGAAVWLCFLVVVVSGCVRGQVHVVLSSKELGYIDTRPQSFYVEFCSGNRA